MIPKLTENSWCAFSCCNDFGRFVFVVIQMIAIIDWIWFAENCIISLGLIFIGLDAFFVLAVIAVWRCTASFNCLLSPIGTRIERFRILENLFKSFWIRVDFDDIYRVGSGDCGGFSSVIVRDSYNLRRSAMLLRFIVKRRISSASTLSLLPFSLSDRVFSKICEKTNFGN